MDLAGRWEWQRWNHKAVTPLRSRGAARAKPVTGLVVPLPASRDAVDPADAYDAGGGADHAPAGEAGHARCRPSAAPARGGGASASQVASADLKRRLREYRQVLELRAMETFAGAPYAEELPLPKRPPGAAAPVAPPVVRRRREADARRLNPCRRAEASGGLDAGGPQESPLLSAGVSGMSSCSTAAPWRNAQGDDLLPESPWRPCGIEQGLPRKGAKLWKTNAEQPRKPAGPPEAEGAPRTAFETYAEATQASSARSAAASPPSWAASLRQPLDAAHSPQPRPGTGKSRPDTAPEAAEPAPRPPAARPSARRAPRRRPADGEVLEPGPLHPEPAAQQQTSEELSWAIAMWASAVFRRFASLGDDAPPEDGEGLRTGAVLECAEWLEHCVGAQGGVLRSLAELDAACYEIGLDEAESSAVASRLWAGLASDGELPVEALLNALEATGPVDYEGPQPPPAIAVVPPSPGWSNGGLRQLLPTVAEEGVGSTCSSAVPILPAPSRDGSKAGSLCDPSSPHRTLPRAAPEPPEAAAGGAALGGDRPSAEVVAALVGRIVAKAASRPPRRARPEPPEAAAVAEVAGGGSGAELPAAPGAIGAEDRQVVEVAALVDRILAKAWRAQEDRWVPGDVVELKFHSLSFAGLDHAAFGRDLLRGLAELGASERALARLKISLRAGSVVASLHGPSAALLELRGLPLARLSVQGCMAEVLGAGAEEGREARAEAADQDGAPSQIGAPADHDDGGGREVAQLADPPAAADEASCVEVAGAASDAAPAAPAFEEETPPSRGAQEAERGVAPSEATGVEEEARIASDGPTDAGPQPDSGAGGRAESGEAAPAAASGERPAEEPAALDRGVDDGQPRGAAQDTRNAADDAAPAASAAAAEDTAPAASNAAAEDAAPAAAAAPQAACMQAVLEPAVAAEVAEAAAPARDAAQASSAGPVDEAAAAAAAARPAEGHARQASAAAEEAPSPEAEAVTEELQTRPREEDRKPEQDPVAQEILRGAEEEEVPPVDAPHAPLAQEAEAVGPSSAEERGATANPGDRLDVQAPAAEHAEADRAQDGRGLEEAAVPVARPQEVDAASASEQQAPAAEGVEDGRSAEQAAVAARTPEAERKADEEQARVPAAEEATPGAEARVAEAAGEAEPGAEAERQPVEAQLGVEAAEAPTRAEAPATERGAPAEDGQSAGAAIKTTPEPQAPGDAAAAQAAPAAPAGDARPADEAREADTGAADAAGITPQAPREPVSVAETPAIEAAPAAVEALRAAEPEAAEPEAAGPAAETRDDATEERPTAQVADEAAPAEGAATPALAAAWLRVAEAAAAASLEAARGEALAYTARKLAQRRPPAAEVADAPLEAKEAPVSEEVAEPAVAGTSAEAASVVAEQPSGEAAGKAEEAAEPPKKTTEDPRQTEATADAPTKSDEEPRQTETAQQRQQTEEAAEAPKKTDEEPQQAETPRRPPQAEETAEAPKKTDEEPRQAEETAEAPKETVEEPLQAEETAEAPKKTDEEPRLAEETAEAPKKTTEEPGQAKETAEAPKKTDEQPRQAEEAAEAPKQTGEQPEETAKAPKRSDEEPRQAEEAAEAPKQTGDQPGQAEETAEAPKKSEEEPRQAEETAEAKKKSDAEPRQEEETAEAPKKAEEEPRPAEGTAEALKRSDEEPRQAEEAAELPAAVAETAAGAEVEKLRSPEPQQVAESPSKADEPMQAQAVEDVRQGGLAQGATEMAGQPQADAAPEVADASAEARVAAEVAPEAAEAERQDVVARQGGAEQPQARAAAVDAQGASGPAAAAAQAESSSAAAAQQQPASSSSAAPSSTNLAAMALGAASPSPSRASPRPSPKPQEHKHWGSVKGAVVVGAWAHAEKVAYCKQGHALEAQSPSSDGWACDGRREAWGCRSGITDYYQTEGVPRFACSRCDFDLCKRCHAFVACQGQGVWESGPSRAMQDTKAGSDKHAPPCKLKEDLLLARLNDRMNRRAAEEASMAQELVRESSGATSLSARGSRRPIVPQANSGSSSSGSPARSIAVVGRVMARLGRFGRSG